VAPRGGGGFGVGHPAGERGGVEVREHEGEVREVALRIDREDRHAVGGDVFQRANKQAGRA
jgi:hypothetical protein